MVVSVKSDALEKDAKGLLDSNILDYFNKQLEHQTFTPVQVGYLGRILQIYWILVIRH